MAVAGVPREWSCGGSNRHDAAQYTRRRSGRCISVPMNADTKVALDTMWVLVTAFLVFFMNAGFAMFESGLCRSKNAVNILAKNFVVFAVASLGFWLVGFALMFGDGSAVIGFSGWLLPRPATTPLPTTAYPAAHSTP